MKHIKLYEEFVESVSESKKFSDAFAVLDFFGGALPNDYSKALKATRKAGYDLPTSLYYEAADLAQDGVNEKREDIGKYNTVKKVVTENFPGPGETVDAKDLDYDMLDYFNRTNTVLSIDTKSKKGIKGSVGKMYGDLVFNGDSINKKDIVRVKILESKE